MIYSYIIKLMEYVERIELCVFIYVGCDVICLYNN